MLRADKWNSCSSSDSKGEMERGATFLLRQDKVQQDKLFSRTNITSSVYKITYGRQVSSSLSYCLLLW